MCPTLGVSLQTALSFTVPSAGQQHLIPQEDVLAPLDQNGTWNFTCIVPQGFTPYMMINEHDFLQGVGIDVIKINDTSSLLVISDEGLDHFVNRTSMNGSAILNISCCAIDYGNQFKFGNCTQSHIICFGELAVI